MNTEQEKEIESLLERIIAKGNYGRIIGKTVLKQDYDPNQFLIQCYDHINTHPMQMLWDKELIKDIVEYNVRYNGKERNENPSVRIR